MTLIKHQNNFATHLTSNTTAGAAMSMLDDMPMILPPFYLAFDVKNINKKYEVVLVTDVVATHVIHAATLYNHTTNEDVSMILPAEELDTYTTQEEVIATVNAAVLAIMQSLYPVGTIYTNLVNSANPSTYFGFGTWAAIAGKVVVGFDSTQTEFDTAGKTGGAKTHLLTGAESGEKGHGHSDSGHGHSLIGNGLTASGSSWSQSSGAYSRGDGLAVSTGYANISAVSANNASSAHNNLQPYITCFIWKRTV